ncbi:centrosome assembly protein spindle defective 2 isoform X2 [Musca autumnalis]|uniref:centrosome assembly protein spindle defective 2 isoform X2 n=1 Tax=Musca autumnalis TaxID=221902 RepID=UPI003CEB96CE
MERRTGNSILHDDSSLGILNMDSLKARGRFFGDISNESFKNTYKSPSNISSDRRISDRLNMERKKALEALQKADSKSPDVFKKPHQISAANKENMKSIINNGSSTENSMQTTSSNPPSATKDAKISFEPTEITGRSTLYKKEIRNLKAPRAMKQLKNISVEEILASSFAPKTRNLCKSFQQGSCDTSLNVSGGGEMDASASKLHGISMVSSSTVCSSFDQYQDSKSLPRTADMSLSKKSFSQLSFNGEHEVGGTSFSFNAGAGTANETGLSNEEFAPGELMQSKLLMDEISWAQEYAAIPAKTLSEKAKEKAAIAQEEAVTNGFESPSASNSMIAGDPNFSVGNFFHMRSENIWDIVKSKSPEKCRTPFALVDEDDSNMVSTSNINGDGYSVPATPIIDNKTYTRVNSQLNVQHESKDSGNASENSYLLSMSAIGRALENLDGGASSTKTIKSSTTLDVTPKVDNKTYTRVSSLINSKHESKDSGNVTDNSYLLSMSAIDRALENLDSKNTSTTALTGQLIMQAKKSRSCMNPQTNSHHDNSSMDARPRSALSLDSDMKMPGQDVANLILENKENVDPITGRGSNGSRIDLSDTISFTESLLNSSDVKKMNNSQTQQQKQPRSPLSPIEVASTTPNICVTEAPVDDGAEADNDEWPGTPKQNLSRRVRRKSPRERSPMRPDVPDSPNDDDDNARTPVNSRASRSFGVDKRVAAISAANKEPKSLCSTRLDGDPRNAAVDCDFGISPNLSSSKVGSSLVARSASNAQLSPRSVNEFRMESSPLSSTASTRYQYSQSSSPTPTLDTTSNSERQLLTAGGGIGGVGLARKAVSSPVGSEASSTCSYSTVHSARSAASASNMRSISRCSNSSEFSHRDAKQIPLKVTTLELSWGSIKLRSDSRKSMQIKNIVSKRLVIRIEVSGPGFQIVNSERNNTITMHSQECRSINISFCPTVRGVAIGKLSFYAPTSGSGMGQSFLDVALYGYGGNASVVPQNILMGPVGSPFITMGDLCELTHPLERTVSFYNKGPLMAFAVVSIDSLGLLLPRLCDAFEIYPQKVLIPPQHTVDVRITFKPRREEVKKMLKKMRNVLTLANMRVICGDEANRQRIRRLLKQMSEADRAKMSSNVLDMLWTQFDDEVEMKELANIHENPSVAMDLASGFRIHEILLTLNYDNMDETAEASSLFLPEGDETVLFRTVVCAADSPTPPPTSSLGTVNEMYEEDIEVEERAVTNGRRQHQQHHHQLSSSWSVKPSILEINLNRRFDRTSLFVHNGFKSRQYFEIACTKKHLFKFSPSEGYVAPDNGQTEVVVNLSASAKEEDLRGDVLIMVYMENERITVPVKFINGAF